MNRFSLDSVLNNYKVASITDCYPLYSEEKLKELIEDIDEEGLKTRLHFAVKDGTTYLLDGRHRLKALTEIYDGIPILTHDQVVYADIDPEDPYEVSKYIRSLHRVRRDETVAQRNETIRKERIEFENYNKKIKMESGQETGRGNRKKVSPDLAKPLRDRSGHARDQLAKNHGISTGTVSNIEAVDKYGTKSVINKMDEGKISPTLGNDLVKTFPSHEDQEKLAELDKKEIRGKINEEIIRKVNEDLKRQAEEDRKIAEEVKRGNELFMERLKEAHGDYTKVVKIRNMEVRFDYKSEGTTGRGMTFEITNEDHIIQIVEILKSIVPIEELDFSNMDFNK